MLNTLKNYFRYDFSLITKILFSVFIVHYGSYLYLGQITAINKITFGLYVIFIFLILINKLYLSELKIGLFKYQFLLLVFSSLFLYSFFLNRSNLNISWFLGDVMVFFGIIFSMLLGHFFKLEIFNSGIIKRLCAMLFVILVLNVTISILFIDEPRIRSVSRLIFLPSFFIYQMFKTKEKIYLYLTLICFLLSILSNTRYAFVVMLLMVLLYSIFFYRKNIYNLLSLKNILTSVTLFIFIIYILLQNNILQQWSFYVLFTPELMGNLGIINVFLGRVFEVQDAYSELIKNFNLFSIFFGNGFGASYEMNELWNFYFQQYAHEGSVSSENRRHVLHFGPARFFFRYGLVGIFLVLYILYTNLKTLFIIYSKKTNDLELFFAITLLMYLIRFPLQPIFNDIIILYCLSGMLNHRHFKDVN